MQHGIHIFIYSIDFHISNIALKKQMEAVNIYMDTYKTFTDLHQNLDRIKKKYRILHIDTLEEYLIQDVNRLRDTLQSSVTPEYKLFNNKALQRRKNQELKASYQVDFVSRKTLDLDFNDTKNEIPLPWIIKPINGVESSRIGYIHNQQDCISYTSSFGQDDTLLIEEYIEGTLYSIDYYVDYDGNFFLTPPIVEKTAQDIKINDFFIYYRGVTLENYDDTFLQNLKDFIRNHVNTYKLKNTFVHHEFKHTLSGSFKSIEINGRIGGKRILLLQDGYNINIYNSIIHPLNLLDTKLRAYAGYFYIYPKETGFFKEYNTDLFKQIKNLKSTHFIDIYFKNSFKQKVGLSKDGYWNLGTIYLKNNSKQQFMEDYIFIEKNYKKLIILM